MAIKRTMSAPTPQTRPGAKGRVQGTKSHIPAASYKSNPLGEVANNKGTKGKTRTLGNRR